MICPVCRKVCPDGTEHCDKCGNKTVIAKGLFAKNYFADNFFFPRIIIMGLVDLFFSYCIYAGTDYFLSSTKLNLVKFNWWILLLLILSVVSTYLFVKTIVVLCQMNRAYARYCRNIANSTAKKTSSNWICKKCNTVNNKDYCSVCGEDEPPKFHPARTVWVCEGCGVVNYSYVGTCGCGELKPEGELIPEENVFVVS